MPKSKSLIARHFFIFLPLTFLYSSPAFGQQFTPDFYYCAAEGETHEGHDSKSVGDILANFNKSDNEEGHITYRYLETNVFKKDKLGLGSLEMRLVSVKKNETESDTTYFFNGFVDDGLIHEPVSGTFSARRAQNKQYYFEIVVLSVMGTLKTQVTDVRSEWARKTIARPVKVDFGEI